MVAKYRDLILDYVSGRLSAQDFESRYLQVFKTDADQVPGNEFDLLERLFFLIDDYVADPDLRAKVSGLDDDELRDGADEIYSQLYGEHIIDQISSVTTVDFEVYLLMTMKLRIKMSHKEAELEAKLAEHALSVASAERIRERVADALGDEANYFANMQKLIRSAEQDATTLQYESVLWPGFTFKASGDEGGRLVSARYWRTSGNSRGADSPVGLAIWSVDFTEFEQLFGPLTAGRKWSLFDPLVPAYEEYEFRWRGESYGVGFSWGLFMFSAMSWD